MKLVGSFFTILIVLFTNKAVFSDTNQEPVFDVSKQEIVFRRTTLIVRNIEASLKLYKDALGMEVVYDNILTSRDGSKSRLIFLKTKDEHVGILGLWELDYGSPLSDRRNLPVERKAFVPQGNIHLFNTNDLDKKWKRVIEVPGVEVYREPASVSYTHLTLPTILRV